MGLIPKGFLFTILNDDTIKLDDIVIEDGKITGIKGIGGADTVTPFKSSDSDYPDSLTLIRESLYDNGGVSIDLSFAGKCYSYATLTGCDYFGVYINGIRLYNGKSRFTPKDSNSITIRSAIIKNKRLAYAIVLSKT